MFLYHFVACSVGFAAVSLHLGLLKRVSLWISSTACGHRLLSGSLQWLPLGRALVHLADEAVAGGVLDVGVPQDRALHSGEGLDEVRHQMDRIDAIGDEHGVSHAKVASVTGARFDSVDATGTVLSPHIAVVAYDAHPLRAGDEHHVPRAQEVSALAAKCDSLDATCAGLASRIAAIEHGVQCLRSCFAMLEVSSALRIDASDDLADQLAAHDHRFSSLESSLDTTRIDVETI